MQMTAGHPSSLQTPQWRKKKGIKKKVMKIKKACRLHVERRKKEKKKNRVSWSTARAATAPRLQRNMDQRDTGVFIVINITSGWCPIMASSVVKQHGDPSRRMHLALISACVSWRRRLETLEIPKQRRRKS